MGITKSSSRLALLYGTAGMLLAIAGVILLMEQSKEENSNQESDATVTQQIEKAGTGLQLAADGHSHPECGATEGVSVDAEDTYSELPADFPLSRSTISELLGKGFPLMSNPRKAAYNQTVGQPIHEVVADLGNPFVIMYCRRSNSIAATPCSMSRLNNEIPSNIKVLRLIEEGRKNREEIGPLIEETISNCLEQYDVVCGMWERMFRPSSARPPENSSVSESDEYYRRHKRYELSPLEIHRIHYVVYSSFYILANIGELNNPALLSAWIRKRKAPTFESPDMDAWLIDCYFNASAADTSPICQKHRQITKGQLLSGSRVKMSKWDALWDIHHPLIAARDVDVADIETIDVLEIPLSLPVEGRSVDQIISNFLVYCEQRSNQ